MSPVNSTQRDRQFQEAGANEHRIQQLERQVAQQCNDWETGAREWKRMHGHQRDLAEWLIDHATNDDGRVTKPRVDAALGGEAFIPCSFTFIAKGRKYHMFLVSTVYEVQEM